jgi:acyl-CoA reductase-like NAD-dependent aldehyde dehydrogenase
MLSLSQKVIQFGVVKKLNCANQIKLTRMMHALMRNQAYVDGKWIGAADNRTFNVVNPANLKVIGQVPDCSRADCQKAIDAAYDAFYSKEWRGATAKERSSLLKVNATLIAQHSMNF